MNFLNIGPGEMIFVLALALLIFGPKRLPELARDLGKAVRSFQQASQQITSELTKEMSEASKTLDQASDSVSGALSEVANTTAAELSQAAAAASGELHKATGAINTELQQAAAAASAPQSLTQAAVEPAVAGIADLPPNDAVQPQRPPSDAAPAEPEPLTHQTEDGTAASEPVEGSTYVI